MCTAVSGDSDITFGIYENPDYVGETSGFGNNNYKYIKAFTDTDAYIYDLMQTIKARPSYDDEDWLIIVTADHGGEKKTHGSQSAFCKYTFA